MCFRKKRGIDWLGRKVIDEGIFNDLQVKSKDISNIINMGLCVKSNEDIYSIILKDEENFIGCLSGRPLFGNKCTHKLNHGSIDLRSVKINVNEALLVDKTISNIIYTVICNGNIKVKACVLSIMQNKLLWIYIQDENECGSCAYNRAYKEHCNFIIN